MGNSLPNHDSPAEKYANVCTPQVMNMVTILSDEYNKLNSYRQSYSYILIIDE
jgi:hypothetical protein